MNAMAARKVLLVGWDAADWKVIRPLMDAGEMPNVQRLVQTGATGQISTLHPPLSPMLWTSIATGKRPFKHGIHGFAEPTPDGRGVQPISNLSRKSKAIWNILTQNDLRSIVIGWWPSNPAEPIRGVMVSDHYHRASGPYEQGWPMRSGTVHPPELAEQLADLRVHPDLLTPSMVEAFIPLAREIDQERDKRLALFMRTLGECMSIQAAAVWLLDNQPWDFFAVYFDAIDHFCHGFMRYHPPRQAWIGERDFALYSNVVSKAYQLHDQMLGTLLEKAGPDVTVVLMSDHGFHPDHLRPASIPDIPAGPAVEHRDYGIIALGGPGIKAHEWLQGASVLDIAPTILSMYGLPIGEDMDGKVLGQAFVEAPNAPSIPSWEDVPGGDGRHPPHTRLDPVGVHESIEQLIALGYIERPDEDHEVAVARTIRELRYNLGEAYQDDARHREAYEIFSALHAADRDELRFAVRLFVSCQALGFLEEMRRIVEDLDGRRRDLYEQAPGRIDVLRNENDLSELARWRNLARFQPPVVAYLKAQLFAAEKRYEDALAALESVKESHLLRPGVSLQSADLYLGLDRWREAQAVYEAALAIDPDNSHAHLGLSRVALRRKRFHDAVKSSLDALQSDYSNPTAHFLLALALDGLKLYPRAAEALRAAISLNPNFPEAHSRLALILDRRLGNPEAAREHRRLASRMKNNNSRLPALPTVTESLSTAQTVTFSSAAQPPLEECLIVVSGLPRSGTSMLMQMLAAGGVPVLSDGLREPDNDNPRGYLEFEPVKHLLRDSRWLFGAKGKAVKIVAPLLSALPHDLPARVILIERDMDQVLDSQASMLKNRQNSLSMTVDRRRLLREEYVRTLAGVKAMLAMRTNVQVLTVEYQEAMAAPLLVAGKLNSFLDQEFDLLKMAAAIDPGLHRNRGAVVT
jgi:predicted AlkP superfamily phosphohydrolase/phosphomutase/tetratricopeptide (TPR) repeat protein